MPATCGACGEEITRREDRLNAGLCDSCLTEALRREAREIAENLRDVEG